MLLIRCGQLRVLHCPPGTSALARLYTPPGSFPSRTDPRLSYGRSWSRVIRTAAATSLHKHDHLLSTPNHSPRFPSIIDNKQRNQAAMATQQTQKRGHAGHQHHHQDNTYLVSTNKNDAGVRITRIGLWSNLGMAIGKGVGGYLFNSQAMIADAWHSLTDLASDVLTLATVSWSLKPPTAMFPTGFGKVESLGSLGVSGMLLGGGLFMCYSSSLILYAHFMADPHAAAELLAHAHSHGHSHSHGHDAIAPSLNAAWLAAGTVVLKEWLYQASELSQTSDSY
jgi:hypothetical protein